MCWVLPGRQQSTKPLSRAGNARGVLEEPALPASSLKCTPETGSQGGYQSGGPTLRFEVSVRVGSSTLMEALGLCPTYTGGLWNHGW
jgi:hypothetical protein